MAEIFLSYKSEDRALVETLARALEREGISVWWDRKIVAGGAWREAIAREIRVARVMVAAWSKRTEDVASAAWMLNEVDEAARLRIPIIPVLLEPCQPPLGFRHVQAADLSNWRGQSDHPEWREVLGGVRAALAVRPYDNAPREALDRRRGGAPITPFLLTASLALGAWLAWRELGPGQDGAPVARKVAAAAAEPVEAAPAPQAAATPVSVDDWVGGELGDRREVVAYQGADYVRGVFVRARGDMWIERNSEIGRAGRYVVVRSDGPRTELYDAQRDLYALIDRDSDLISIKSAGENEYTPRYRIAAFGAGEAR